MINNECLLVGIVTKEYKDSKCILDLLFENAEPDTIKFYNRNVGVLRIDNCVYKVLGKYERGYKDIDQLIYDYELGKLCLEILKYSCIPRKFQIIDYRSILYDDFLDEEHRVDSEIVVEDNVIKIIEKDLFGNERVKKFVLEYKNSKGVSK